MAPSKPQQVSFNDPAATFFDDLSPNEGNRDNSPGTGGNGSGGEEVPRMKRIACVVCRKRKLKCDGQKPSCGTCSRLGHDCSYDEVRRKSGPKRGYVKALEARLAQVETLLKNNDAPAEAPRAKEDFAFSAQEVTAHKKSDNINFGISLGATTTNTSSTTEPWNDLGLDLNLPMNDVPLSWDMMAMGLEESLPEQNVIDELHQIYFEKVHRTLPVIHRSRYLNSMHLAPNLRPPVALRYAVWCLAASVHDKYSSLQTVYYRRSRKYAEEAELKGHGENVISVQISQTWSLLAAYEFKLMYFPRAWLSTGRAVRLSQMMGLHRLDGQGLDVKQCLPPPRDWTEKEERRRTFWAAFCVDRYASIGTGWPMTVEEKDILTNLPANEEAYDQGKPEPTLTLKDAMSPDGASTLSPFGGVVLMASLFGRNLIHLHRPDPDDRDDDLNGEFWRRHRQMDNILLNTALSLPSHFRLPSGIDDPNIVFTNMNIHTSTICLHQAAIFKADKNRLPATVSAESKIRCITAAAEIASIMRMISHLDLSKMNPFISFCLYVAARVFVQYLKSRPGDEQVRASLQFLLTAMGHLKKMNPLTESFLVQLDVDLTGSLDHPANNAKFAYSLKKGQAEIYVPSKGATGGPQVQFQSEQSKNLEQQLAEAQAPSADIMASPLPFPGCEIQGAGFKAGVDRMTGNSRHNSDSGSNANPGLSNGNTSSSASPASTSDHHPSISTPGSSTHNTPAHHTGFSPMEETRSSTTQFPSNAAMLNLASGGNPMQPMYGFDSTMMGTETPKYFSTGFTPKDSTQFASDPQFFDMSATGIMDDGSGGSMFSDMLSMTPPADWAAVLGDGTT